MPTAKQLANLKRGGAPATAEAAAAAREAKAALAAEDARLAALAGPEPMEAYEDLHAVMTTHVRQLLQKEQRSGAKPLRETTERLREYRQLTEALIIYRRSKGAERVAEQFFEGMESRVQALLGRTACRECGTVVQVVQPLVEPPSE